MSMNKLFSVGDIIYGFCNGYFGSRDYDTKICVLVTERFALFIYIEGDNKGDAVVLNKHFSIEAIEESMVKKWKINPNE